MTFWNQNKDAVKHNSGTTFCLLGFPTLPPPVSDSRRSFEPGTARPLWKVFAGLPRPNQTRQDQPPPKLLELPFEPRSWESEETVEMDKSSLQSFTAHQNTLAMSQKQAKSSKSKASTASGKAAKSAVLLACF